MQVNAMQCKCKWKCNMGEVEGLKMCSQEEVKLDKTHGSVCFTDFPQLSLNVGVVSSDIIWDNKEDGASCLPWTKQVVSAIFLVLSYRSRW